MSYTVRFTDDALQDLTRLYAFLAERDLAAARRAIGAIRKAVEMLETFPFACRKASPSRPALREMPISFGDAGYVALYEIEDGYVTVLAVRHQLEDDYY
ncbi:MAG: type II toxin-antitoxin system RelE/ParE family toxin [Rhodanobacteraceae bacterium]